MYRKLTSDYFIKRIWKSKTPTDYMNNVYKLWLFLADHWKYQFSLK